MGRDFWETTTPTSSRGKSPSKKRGKQSRNSQFISDAVLSALMFLLVERIVWRITEWGCRGGKGDVREEHPATTKPTRTRSSCCSLSSNLRFPKQSGAFKLQLQPKSREGKMFSPQNRHRQPPRSGCGSRGYWLCPTAQLLKTSRAQAALQSCAVTTAKNTKKKKLWYAINGSLSVINIQYSYWFFSAFWRFDFF